MLDSTTKQCSKCGETKLLSDFRLRKRKGDPSPYPYCIICQNKEGKNYRVLNRGKNKKASMVESEIRVIAQLKRMGIFATNGKASDYKRVDVVVWGCIPIEVKTATLDKNGQYVFAFSNNQVERGTQAHFIVLVILPEDAPASFHVFPSGHPIFYANGKLKWRVPYTPGPKGRSHLSDYLMNKYKDAWHQIEEQRLQISRRLML